MPDPTDRRQRQARTKDIGDSLRKLYEDVAAEPVPDDFMRLLEMADEAADDDDAAADDHRQE